MEIIDQNQLRAERIARNAQLYELGVLALSSREQSEVREFQRATREVLQDAAAFTVQAARNMQDELVVSQ